jgi:hypothetical protein
MAAGYVYVLANSSMPGLVKVGKTTRLPSERADELSGVTGVATPFIVVYEEHFEDCDAVEAHVHTALTENGLRLSENREFFRAPVSDVVKIIISSRPPNISIAPGKPEIEIPRTPDGPEFDSFRLALNPWDHLMHEANKHYYGRDGYFEDHSEAFKLYRDAARLGSPKAYERLGDMYRVGESVPEDHQRALDCYKEGAKRGNYFCYAGMTNIFLSEGHAENAQKSFSMFITGGEADDWKASAPFTNGYIDIIKWVLVHPNGLNSPRLLRLARSYFPQLRRVIKRDLEPYVMDAHPKLKSALAELLDIIESDMQFQQIASSARSVSGIDERFRVEWKDFLISDGGISILGL